MINKSVLIIGFGLAIAKSRQDESIFLYPYFLQSVRKGNYEVLIKEFILILLKLNPLPVLSKMIRVKFGQY